MRATMFVGQIILLSALPSLEPMYYRRRLPHWQPENAEYFVTWRLAGSLPKPVPDLLTADVFRKYDAALDRATGPLWLADPRIAKVVQDAIVYGETARGL
jgi:REP-associated tyrosine transposase